VIGASRPSAQQERLAEQVGQGLGAAGAIVITGGGPGVMAAASRGARAGGARAGGARAGGAHADGAVVVGILPGTDPRAANEWVTVALPTGIGELRNGLIVRAADAVVAVGGAYGTLSEIALALSAGVGVVGLDTWAIDGVHVADSPAAALGQVLELAARAVAGRA